MRKTFAGTAAVAMAAAMGLAAPATAASTEPAEQQVNVAPAAGPFRIKNRATGLCLFGPFAATAYASTCSSNSPHYWYWNQHADGWWEVRNLGNGLCLDANGNGAVYTHPCNGGTYQRWLRLSDGHIDHYASYGFLDSNHRGAVYTQSWNDGNFQRWDLLVI